jgi:pyruvate,water dikinase
MSGVLSQAALVDGPDRAEIGGKASGLVRLARLRLPVPRFFVVSPEALDASGLRADALAAVREAVEGLGDVALAVRSSAAAEDGATASWAGQFETVLGARGPDAVVAAIARCVASARSERVRAYAEMHGLTPGAMAVVVQELVVGEASGVCFSRDPEDPERTLISVGLGLGEGVVQGLVPCDAVRVDARGAVEVELSHKDAAVRLVDGAPAEVPVEAAVAAAPAIDEAVAREIARCARVVERATGRPQDLEFTVRDGRVVLLQARPITAPIPLGRRLLWDNSNIVESYSGVTTPLTFSFASKAYTIVYQLFCRVMGVRESVIRENEPTFRRMIGYLGGRVYYNLNAWYRLIQLLPGYEFNRGAMETMMGVSEVAADDDAGASQSRWVAGLEVARLGGRLGWRLLWLERDAAAFQRRFDEALARARAVDLGALRLDQLLAHYEEVERELLWAWTPPLVNDFFTMIFYKALQKQCAELTGDPATQLHNELVAGEGTLASAAPARDLLDLARYCAGVPALAEVLRGEGTDREVLASLGEDAGFSQRFARWMERYGDRSPDELKLEAPTLLDTPEFLLGTLRAVARDPSAVREFGDREAETRRRAEARAAGLVDGALARWRFRFVLGQARRRVAMRESLRFERTRIFGHVRRIFRAFGERLVEADRLDLRDDVFFLSVDEILGFARGTTVSTDLRGLVALRRAEHAAHLAADPPDERFWTWGAVHVHNRFRRPARAEAPPEGDELRGTACSPGVVEGVARVVRDPREVPDLGGAILVAHRTDPGWVPLYPTASAILVERGSLLSHSAVIARELGLPAVVGCRGLLDWVRDGERIGLDGSTGRVWKLDADG